MPRRNGHRFLLVYGSQTGQAQAIAEEIEEKAGGQGFFADLHCLSIVEKKFSIEREKCVVIVLSTTGDGEPPDTALKFVRRLKKKTLPNNYLSHLNYALLGLGDSNYTNFCKCAETLNQRLKELGAQTFYTPGWADDAVGLEVVVEPWIDGLWSALRTFLRPPLDISSQDIISANGCDSQTVNLTNNEASLNGCVSSQEQLLNKMSDCKSVNSELQGDNPNQILLTNQNGDTISQSPGPGGDTGQVPECTENNELCNQNLNPSAIDVSFSHNGQNVTTSEGVLDVRNASIDIANTNNSNNPSTVQDSKSVVQNKIKTDTISVQRCSSDSLSSTHLEKDEVCSTAENSSVALTSGQTPLAKEPSLKHSVSPLLESALTIPVLPPAYLKLEFKPDETINVSELPLQNDFPLPSAASPVTMATVLSADILTAETALKKTLCVELDVSSGDFKYQPGDSFSVVCPNNKAEVEQLLNRLGLSEGADVPYRLSIIEGTKKKNPSIPKYVPDIGTLRHIFTTCLDIREPPKKSLLRVFLEYVSDETDKRRLQELCSKQGNNHYASYIREPNISLLDILNTFSSCSPPVERIIEHLPRLQPRPYSVCSSQLTCSDVNTVQFVFNVIEIPVGGGRTYSRRGVCTGWLDDRTQMTQKQKFCVTPENDLVSEIKNLTVDNQSVQVPVFMRTNQTFRLPDDNRVPVIMVGPGTGVAPFIGFLHHRAAMKLQLPETELGEAWLFYGCRHKDRDFLFKQEMEQFLKTGTLSTLHVSFSREDAQSESPRYVQDNIRKHGQHLIKLLDNTDAVIYVCGDARNMAKDVNKAFVDIFSDARGISAEEATKIVMELRLKKRYLEDVWT